MKKSIIAAAILCAVVVLCAGCGNHSQEQKKTGNVISAKETAVQISEEAEAKTSEQKESEINDISSGKTIAVYFSRVGNTDFPEGVDAVSSASLQLDHGILKGNAQLIAEWIADEMGCETSEIVSEELYPVDYDQTVDQARNEQNDSFRPALKTILDDVGEYNTIYLVFPNWWADLPMPVYSFFEANDFSGKTIKVFITHEGSRFSRTIDTIRNLEPDAEVIEGLAIRGGSVKDEEQNIRKWVQEN